VVLVLQRDRHSAHRILVAVADLVQPLVAVEPITPRFMVTSVDLFMP
jgi:hypothetical protein